MKYVRCVHDGFNGESFAISLRLTIGKIYEVLEINYNKDGISIHILDNLNTKASYYMSVNFVYLNKFDTKHWFVDATSELREEKINKILE
jgi:hypothetical protein